MDHFDLTQWTDYVRGVTPAGATREMAEHAGMCRSCSLILELLHRVAEVTAADRAFTPSADLVESAESIFPAPGHVNRGLRAGLRRLRGQLAWNSAVDPMPAGVRSLRPDVRHYVYRAGRYSVDLLLDSDPGTSMVTMTGQIADESTPDTPFDKTKALLFSGKRMVASATTNEFGEFSIRYEPSGNLRLFLPVELTGEYVELPLDVPEVNA